jgi:hypothetical protein
MAKAWIVYKDDETLGPFDAAEIRELLRDGTLDPFDQVAQQGSQIKRELVEVDEIFYAENNLKFGSGTSPGSTAAQNVFGSNTEPSISAIKDVGSSPKTSVSTMAPSRDDGPDELDLLTNNSSSARNMPTVPATVPTPGMKLLLADHAAVATGAGQELVKSDKGRNRSPASRPRKDPKKFQIVDEAGRVLGPLSAGEIQALFFKGVLGASVRVMKVGTNSKVPVKKFVAVYTQSKGQNHVQQGAHPQMAARPPQVQRGPSYSSPHTANPTQWMVAVMMAIVLAGGGWFGYELMKNHKISFSWFAKEKRQSSAKKSKKSKKLNSSKGSLPRPKAYKNKYKKPKKQYFRKKPKKKNSIYKRQTKPKYVQKPTPRKAKLVRPSTFKKAYAPKRVAYKPKKSVGYTGPKVSTLRAGMNVSGLGPMAFDVGAVKSCKMKCNVQMVGAGGRVTVKFFKIHYADKLLSRGGRVWISGLVQKAGGQTTILLNDVR